LNLYDALPPKTGESFTTLLEHKNVRIVRILSSDTPDRKEYIQEEDEWVVVLEGSARLEIEGKSRSLKLGEMVFLPAGTPHRVLETDPGTLWLAVHIF
jgi:cupin 2 domain-containing protein